MEDMSPNQWEEMMYDQSKLLEPRDGTFMRVVRTSSWC